MARDLNHLLSDLRAFDPTKSASVSPENTNDPAECGMASAVPAEMHDPSGSAATLASMPEAPTMPGGIEKSPQGSVTAPAPGPFVTSGKEANAWQSNLAGLRSKLANFGGAAAPAAPAAAPVKSAAEADLSGFGKYHLLIAAHLMKSASGRVAMDQALNEVVGLEVGRDLLKSAAAEQAEFEAGYLQEKIAAAEQYELHQIDAAQRAQLAAEYRELTKSASAEDITKINQSLFIMKKAEDLFAAHPEAHHAFLVGVDSANKFAAAMEAPPMDPAAGMPPEAGEEMAPEGPPSPEELEAALMELVQAGAITEEQAIELLQQIMGGAEGGAPPPDMEGMPPGAEAMPPEEIAKAAAYADAHLDKVAHVLFAEA